MRRLGETGAEIDAFLSAPARAVSLVEFAAEIYAQRVMFQFHGAPPQAPSHAVVAAVRGALGRSLAKTASPAAISGEPCPYRPACAFDIAWRERRQASGLVIPKPYVIGTDATEAGWHLHLTLFGIATQWTMSFADAVLLALQQGIALPDGTALPARFAVREIVELDGLEPADADFAQVAFLTPLRWRAQDGRFRLRPLLASAANRVSGMARWHGCDIREDWAGLPSLADSIELDTSCLQAFDGRRKSGTGGKIYGVEGYHGTFALRGAPGMWADLLHIGALTHVGSGAGLGFGRYAVALGNLGGERPGTR